MNAPERTAAPAELAFESARVLACGCGARPGYSCDGKGGMHLSRFADAHRLGYLSEDRMGAVLHLAGPVFTPETIVARGGAR